MSISNKFSIVKTGEGYYDFYQKDSASTTGIYYYVATAGGTYTYNDSVGTFDTAGAGGYARFTASITNQVGDDLFDAYFDTVDIYFDKQSLESSTVEWFIKCMTSTANIEVQWTSGSNYTFNSLEQPIAMHRGAESNLLETGAFSNTNVYYGRRNQLHIEQIGVDQHLDSCIKFRIKAKLQTFDETSNLLDEWSVTSIEILGDGSVFIGGRDA